MMNNKIKYEIPASGNVKIRVVDIIGNPVRVILNEHKEPGNYEISLDRESLNPGKYYYKVLFACSNGNGVVKEEEPEVTILTGQVKIEVQ
jgi:hypothetical protein